MKRPLLWTIILATVSLVYSCKKDTGGSNTSIAKGKKIAPSTFNFTTLKKVDLSVRLLTPGNQPIKGVVASVIIPGTKESNGVLFKAASDANGFIKGTFSVPSYLDTLTILPNYPGLMSKANALISSANTVLGTVGGDKSYGGSIIPDSYPNKKGNGTRVLYTDVFTGINFLYPAPYTNSADGTHTFVFTNGNGLPETATGIPNFLTSVGDVIAPSLLNFIANSLPNGQAVSTHHPEYLTTNATGLKVINNSNVSITFVSEGADYRSSLGYYTYPTVNGPPTNVNQISTVKFIFPNSSLQGSGGGLHPGDKVDLGFFTAGTSIAFILLQDAWTGTDINFLRGSGPDPVTKFYTTVSLNPEVPGDPFYSGVVLPTKHTVMLADFLNGLFLFGYEDAHRTNRFINPNNVDPDHDFNDVLFYATPISAFDPTGVPPVDGGDDDLDDDGVPDVNDEYPTDPERAYNQTTITNTIAFEDLWPSTGDYDMNDVVVEYHYKYVKNAANNVVEFFGYYKPLAAGASFKDGFGVEFPFSPSIVQSVTGQRASNITFAANGLEAGQPKAVIFPFDNFNQAINNTNPNDPWINTVMALDKVVGDLITIKISFNSPVSLATVGDYSTYNPFITVEMNRQREVHLPNMPPTVKANFNQFGTHDDNSIIDYNPGTGIFSAGRYYKTVNEWPWAINLAGAFIHPQEGAAVNTAYLHFLDWAQSGGTAFPDWYVNTAGGYRNNNNIYTK